MTEHRSYPLRLLVRYVAGKWVIYVDGDPPVSWATDDTQQNAIEIAKARARRERGSVRWENRGGVPDGEVDYSTPASRRRNVWHRHPAEVTSDRLAEHYEKWTDKFAGDELDAISKVRFALERLATDAELKGKSTP